jgi:hypothetical protein
MRDAKQPLDVVNRSGAPALPRHVAAHNTRPAMPPIERFKRLDVRPLLAKGIEPFPEVRARADALNAGDGLIVVAPFLPSPLIEFLGGEGFRSKIERGQGSDWLVYFWRV